MHLNEIIGSYLYNESKTVWQQWLKIYGKNLKPSTIARERATLQAALNQGSQSLMLPPIKLSSIKEGKQKGAIYLTKEEQNSLLENYNKWVAPIALMLCYQGVRTQEALRLKWRDIDWKRKTIFIAKTKSGYSRTIPMHERVIFHFLTSIKTQSQQIPLMFFYQAEEPPTRTQEGWEEILYQKRIKQLV